MTREKKPQGEKKLTRAKVYRVFKAIGIIAMLIFIYLVINNKSAFVEDMLLKESVPSDQYVSIYDGTKVEQEIELNSAYLKQLIFRIDCHTMSVRKGSLDIKLLDEDGDVVFHATPSMEEVDGTKDTTGHMGIKTVKEKRWYKLLVEKDLDSDQIYTVVVTGKNISKKDALHLFVTPEESMYCTSDMVVDGEQQNFHARMRFKVIDVNTNVYHACIYIPIILILFLLIPYNGKKYKKINAALSFLLFLIYPWITFFMVEQVCGNSMDTMGKTAICLNVIWLYLIYGVFLAIYNRIKPALITGSIVTLLFGIVEYYVLEYRGNPFAPVDLFSASTAKDVLHEYTLDFSMEIMYGIAITMVLVIVACKLKSFPMTKSWKSRVPLTALLVAMIGFQTWIGFQSELLLNHGGIEVNLFNPKKGYYKNGYLLNFAMNIKYMTVQKPEGYSVEEVEKIAKKYKEKAETDTDTNTTLTKNPNIIVIMNETFADLSVINEDLQTNQEVMPFYNSLTENTIKGHMLVSVFGSGTSNSEYEFLTGNSVSGLPSGTNAYAQFLKKETPSIVTQLEEQGYNTIAFHPYKGKEWNRNTVYDLLGFNKFLDWDCMSDDARKIRGWYSDEADYDKVIETYEDNKKSGKPLFLMNVTIQNHGGYTIADSKFKEEIKITDNTEIETADRYLSLIHESDKQLENLVNYFEEQDDPTIIVFYGDHQPKLGDDFYEALYGKSLMKLNLEETQKKFTVPFVIWANYDIESDTDVEYMSDNYLSTLMLDQTNLEKTPYNEFLKEMRKRIPEINANGYLGDDGKYHELDEDNEYSELLKEYSYIEYNCLVDSDKVTEMFSTK